jgi:hypothetical protein
MRIEPPTNLGGDGQFFFALFTHLGDELLGMSITIYISGINKIDAKVNSFIEG